jgi:hypothetical protein
VSAKSTLVPLAVQEIACPAVRGRLWSTARGVGTPVGGPREGAVYGGHVLSDAAGMGTR